jgi:hypothetical protein
MCAIPFSLTDLREVMLRNRDGTFLQHNGEDTSIVSDDVLDDVSMQSLRL